MLGGGVLGIFLLLLQNLQGPRERSRSSRTPVQLQTRIAHLQKSASTGLSTQRARALWLCPRSPPPSLPEHSCSARTSRCKPATPGHSGVPSTSSFTPVRMESTSFTRGRVVAAMESDARGAQALRAEQASPDLPHGTPFRDAPMSWAKLRGQFRALDMNFTTGKRMTLRRRREGLAVHACSSIASASAWGRETQEGGGPR